MPINILMPALSPTMTEGTLARWLKKEGDEIAAGDVIAEIETDKATMEVEAVEEGTLGKILVPDGTDNVQVNQVIAIIKEEGDDDSAIDAAAKKGGGAPAPKQDKQDEAPKQEAKAEKPAPAPEKPSAPESPPSKSPPQKADPGGKAPPAPEADGGRVMSSPLARRLAAQYGLDLSQLKGSGPHGRVVKADVEAAATQGPTTAPGAMPGAAPALMPAGGLKPVQTERGIEPAFVEVKHSNVRKVIARRLTESKQTVPHFYLTVDCEIDALLTARKQINDMSPEGEGAYKLSVNDFIIKAVAVGLRRVPGANASWTDTAVRQYQAVDISIAVATPGGLITPIIHNADLKGLAQISNEMKDLAKRARDNKLKPEEYQGGGFSISNLGMYGIREFAAIINPPQGCILAVGAGEQRPVVRDGEVVVRTVMSCTLA
ncbi:MAG: pyruvate dehydrogenase complex dihydrolipoamide acetyltransferase, partial [Acetobacterales bacterium]